MRTSSTIWGLLALAGMAAACGSSAEEGVDAVPRRDCRVPVWYTPDEGAEEPNPRVVGTFNDWSPSGAALVDDDGDGTYGGWIRPGAGLHRYRIRTADGREHLDSVRPLKMADGAGRLASAVYGSDCSEPELRVESARITGGRLRAELRFRRAVEGPGLDAESVVARRVGGGELPAQIRGGRITIEGNDLPSGKHRIRVEAADQRGRAAEPATFSVWADGMDFSWRDALIYQVFVDRFRSGRGELDDSEGPLSYHGGDLWGVIEKLESGYFESLGVNVLWLSPVYENPEGWFESRQGRPSQAYHGYWPTEPRGVEDRLGGEEALERLVEEAHRRGIRVVLDIVLNHVHRQHPYVQDQPREEWLNRPAGDCVCGVTCSWRANMRSCWFEEFVADLDWRKPEVLDRVLDDTLWWVDRFDVDGFRLDAVPMMPRYAVRHLRARLERRRPEVAPHFYLLGENYVGRDRQEALAYFLGPHTLSGEFRFPLMWALRDAMAGEASMAELDRAIDRGRRQWRGSGAVMAPFLGNHDVRRFTTAMRRRLGEASAEQIHERLEMAWTFVLTQPGAPVIYYGDEIGLRGGADPKNRRPMRFEGELQRREKATLRHVRRLGRLRACSRALRRGDYLAIAGSEGHLVYARRADSGEVAVVAINRAPARKTVQLDDAPGSLVRAMPREGAPVESSREGRISFEVPGGGSTVLLTESECVR